jgi:ubiquinone/menaquinone biosynthesis C-methylase UbiE
MSNLWTARAEAYRQSASHREGPDLDLLVAWARGARTALDVATGGGHVARRLREAGLGVTTLDPSPGMRPDVIARAEDIPFADGSFDVVVTRIAPHHFGDVQAAVAEMARVSRDLVLVEDTLYSSERHEEAERLRDPTHVRNYSEQQWRSFLEAAGLVIEAVERIEKRHGFEEWLARTGCDGAEAERVKELLADRATADGTAWTDTKILLKARNAG